MNGPYTLSKSGHERNRIFLCKTNQRNMCEAISCFEVLLDIKVVRRYRYWSAYIVIPDMFTIILVLQYSSKVPRTQL